MTEARSSALFKRAEQLKRWEESETNKQSAQPKSAARIQFSSGIVFLAACTAGDKEEVQRLLKAGADINTTNVDGLTALHQACIDDNLDMVEFLLKNGADVNRGDNEGWTPLHATASCGFMSIARYLLENGADPSAVNYDGELPIDITDNKSMKAMLQKVIEEKGIDCEASRKAEVNSLLVDAKNWAANGYVDIRDLKTGGTPLHVAAAKGYNEVLQILLDQCKLDPDCVDYEGWTPLHAAALWAQKESATLLLKYGADPNIKNYSGQTCLDLVEPKLSKWLTEAISEAQVYTKVNNNNIHKRKLSPPKLEVKRQDLDKTPQNNNMPEAIIDKNMKNDKVPETKPPKGIAAPPETIAEETHNADEAPSWRRSASFRNKQNDVPRDSKAVTSNNEPPTDNDIILRRTHSFENDRTFYQRYRDVTARIKASSCPSIPPLPQSTLASIESRKKLLEQSSSTNRLNSPTENTNDDAQARISLPEKSERETNSLTSSSSSGSQTPVRSLGDIAEIQNSNNGVPASTAPSNKLSPGTIFKNFFKSFVPPVRDEESETQRKAHAKRVRETRRSTQGVTLDEIKSAEQLVKKKAGNGEVSPTKKVQEEAPPLTNNKESNARRGARASGAGAGAGAGVGAALAAATATATATIAPSAGAGLDRRPSWRLRLDTNKFELEEAGREEPAAAATVTLPLRRMHVTITNNIAADDKGTEDDKDRESSVESKSGSNTSMSSTQAALNVIQRRRRPKRRSTGVGHVEMDDIVNDRSVNCDGGDSENESRQSGNERTSEVECAASDVSGAEERDYKALYEASAAEVRRLRDLLDASEQQLRDARTTITRLTRMSQSSLSEIEKREKRAMERKLSEMEEELKFQQALQAENQRLKDENGALIRVISKLSK